MHEPLGSFFHRFPEVATGAVVTDMGGSDVQGLSVKYTSSNSINHSRTRQTLFSFNAISQNLLDAEKASAWKM